MESIEEQVGLILSQANDRHLQMYRNDAHYNHLVHQLADVLLSYDKGALHAAIDMAIGINQAARVSRGK